MPKAVFVSYFGSILSLAKDLANEANDEPKKAIGAIVMSAASIEGFLNEMLERFSFYNAARPQFKKSELPRKVLALGRLSAELEGRNASVHLKVQLFVATLRGSPWDRGQQPYQDFDLLFRLRNAILHLKPESFDSDVLTNAELHPLLRSLDARVPLKRFGGPKLRNRMLGIAIAVQEPAVAQWAYDTCIRTCLALADCLPRGTIRSSARSTITGKLPRGSKPVIVDPSPGGDNAA
jgi:hypothetical protein